MHTTEVTDQPCGPALLVRNDLVHHMNIVPAGRHTMSMISQPGR